MNEDPIMTPVGGGRQTTTYRVPRAHAGVIPVTPGNFEATEYADPRTGWRGRLLTAKDAVIGNAMSNARLAEERLSKKVALAIFSSDALSSTAYATQEILIVLLIAGTGALTFSLPIGIGIACLLAIVVTSYRQTIKAYPKGGGAYIVGHENLGRIAGLTAASGLLIGYVLTVAVSIAACVEAISSAAPAVHSYAVPLAVALTLVMSFGNLRGLRESGTLFSVPTYGFVVLLGVMIAGGLLKTTFGGENVLGAGEPDRQPAQAGQALTLFLVVRAFAAGCSALTGVEAISNGVQAFKKPEARNAATTMTAMAIILGVLFLGVTVLARHFGIVFEHGDQETVMSQIGEEVFGRNLMYYLLQGFTAGILFLAANTAFAGFPLLGAILARDGYLPRLFHQRGNRLVFSYGIAALTGFSILLLVVFNAETTRLIPLYALGVFLSFTIAQAGMVKRSLTLRSANWPTSALISGAGALATGIVTVILLMTKFWDGAWMVVAALPVITLVLWRIGRFYKRLHRELHISPGSTFDLAPRGRSRTPAIVPVEEINLATLAALDAACERSAVVTAVHVNYDAEDDDRLIKQWDSQFPRIPLVVINSPYRTASEPLAWYIADRLRESPGTTVFLPVVQVGRARQRPLVNQSLKRLKVLLRRRRTVEFIEQPFAISKGGLWR